MTSPRSANTSAEKNALRVRDSIAKSLRAMSQAATSVSATRSHGLAICGCVGRGIEAVAGIVSHKLSPLHHCHVSRQRESLRKIVGDDDDCRPRRAQLSEQRGERARSAL